MLRGRVISTTQTRTILFSQLWRFFAIRRCVRLERSEGCRWEDFASKQPGVSPSTARPLDPGFPSGSRITLSFRLRVLEKPVYCPKPIFLRSLGQVMEERPTMHRDNGLIASVLSAHPGPSRILRFFLRNVGRRIEDRFWQPSRWFPSLSSLVSTSTLVPSQAHSKEVPPQGLPLYAKRTLTAAPPSREAIGWGVYSP